MVVPLQDKKVSEGEKKAWIGWWWWCSFYSFSCRGENLSGFLEGWVVLVGALSWCWRWPFPSAFVVLLRKNKDEFDRANLREIKGTA